MMGRARLISTMFEFDAISLCGVRDLREVKGFLSTEPTSFP
jgi:hypothetical protein